MSHIAAPQEQNLGFVTCSFIRTHKEIAQGHFSSVTHRTYVLYLDSNSTNRVCKALEAYPESYPIFQCTVFILMKQLQYCWQIGPKHDIQYSLHVPVKVFVLVSASCMLPGL